MEDIISIVAQVFNFVVEIIVATIPFVIIAKLGAIEKAIREGEMRRSYEAQKILKALQGAVEG